jgi:hypothetical protein
MASSGVSVPVTKDCSATPRSLSGPVLPVRMINVPGACVIVQLTDAPRGVVLGR